MHKIILRDMKFNLSEVRLNIKKLEHLKKMEFEFSNVQFNLRWKG